MPSKFAVTALLLSALLMVPAAGVGLTTGSTTPATTVSATAVASTVPPHRVTLSGHVTAEDGKSDETYVVVQNASSSAFEDLALSRAIHSGFRKLAHAGGDGEPAYVAHVDADGHYALSLSPGEYDLVAVSPTGLSQLRHVSLDENRTVNATLDTERVQTLHGGDTTVAPGETATARVTLSNEDDAPLTDLRARFDALPDGVSIVGVNASGNGTYDATNRTIKWPSVAPGETASVTVHLRATDDARGSKTLHLDGSAAEHLIQHLDPVRVTVRDPNATSTTTVLPESGGDLNTTGRSTTPRSSNQPRSTTTPSISTSEKWTDIPDFGFAGFVVIVLALAAFVVVTIDRR